MTYKQNLQAILDSHLTEIKDELKEDIIDRIMDITLRLKNEQTGNLECTLYDAQRNIKNWYCSECKNLVAITCELHIAPSYRYCPWCGVKLEVKE